MIPNLFLTRCNFIPKNFDDPLKLRVVTYLTFLKPLQNELQTNFKR